MLSSSSLPISRGLSLAILHFLLAQKFPLGKMVYFFSWQTIVSSSSVVSAVMVLFSFAYSWTLSSIHTLQQQQSTSSAVLLAGWLSWGISILFFFQSRGAHAKHYFSTRINALTTENLRSLHSRTFKLHAKTHFGHFGTDFQLIFEQNIFR